MRQYLSSWSWSSTRKARSPNGCGPAARASPASATGVEHGDRRRQGTATSTTRPTSLNASIVADLIGEGLGRRTVRATSSLAGRPRAISTSPPPPAADLRRRGRGSRAVGSLEPSTIHLPGIYVSRIVTGKHGLDLGRAPCASRGMMAEETKGWDRNGMAAGRARLRRRRCRRPRRRHPNAGVERRVPKVVSVTWSARMLGAGSFPYEGEDPTLIDVRASRRSPNCRRPLRFCHQLRGRPLTARSR